MTTFRDESGQGATPRTRRNLSDWSRLSRSKPRDSERDTSLEREHPTQYAKPWLSTRRTATPCGRMLLRKRLDNSFLMKHSPFWNMALQHQMDTRRYPTLVYSMSSLTQVASTAFALEDTRRTLPRKTCTQVWWEQKQSDSCF